MKGTKRDECVMRMYMHSTRQHELQLSAEPTNNYKITMQQQQQKETAPAQNSSVRCVEIYVYAIG